MFICWEKEREREKIGEEDKGMVSKKKKKKRKKGRERERERERKKKREKEREKEGQRTNRGGFFKFFLNSFYFFFHFEGGLHFCFTIVGVKVIDGMICMYVCIYISCM